MDWKFQEVIHISLVKLITDYSFIKHYNRKRAHLKHLMPLFTCQLESWNLDQNLGRICNRRRYYS